MVRAGLALVISESHVEETKTKTKTYDFVVPGTESRTLLL